MTHVTDISLPVNRTNGSNFVLPGPLSYLDHVPSGATLEPMIRIGKLKSELDLIIGIPTVKRSDDKGEVSYLMKTLSSIVDGAGHRKRAQKMESRSELTYETRKRLSLLRKDTTQTM